MLTDIRILAEAVMIVIIEIVSLVLFKPSNSAVQDWGCIEVSVSVINVINVNKAISQRVFFFYWLIAVRALPL